MAEINRSDLFAKLTPLCFKSLESATMLCKLREHSYVELAHWVFQILQLQDSDLHRIFRQSNINAARLASDITEKLEALSKSGEGLTDLSADVEQAVERAWMYTSLLFHSQAIRSGYLLVGILKTPELKKSLLGLSSELAKIGVERLTEEFEQLTSGSPEAIEAKNSGNTGVAREQMKAAPAAMGGTAALEKYSTDLTLAAEENRLDPVVGRDAEIRQVIDILLRRRQNNPILTGEAGVGKTAVVEGLALRVAQGQVPPALKDMQLLALDVGRLQAGASMKGEFEQRLKQVIDEVQAATRPTILFIDEAHTLLGGGDKGNAAGDAANLLKPALARGTLRTIAATTWSEYKRHIEKDPALTRRFQVVKVDQPSIDSAVRMLRHLTPALEKHHEVRILDEAVKAAVELSSRYVPDRQLPDKAVSLLDTACARVAISQHTVPAKVEDCQKSIESLEVEADIVRREAVVEGERTEHLAKIEENRAELQSELSTLESQWSEEKDLVAELLKLQSEMQADREVETSCGEVAIPVFDESARQSASHAETSQQETSGNSSVDASANSFDWNMQIDTLHPATGYGEDVSLNNDFEAEDSVAKPASEGIGRAAEVPSEVGSQDVQGMQQRLAALQVELASVQGESPLVLATVGEQAVANVVSDWTGIPVGKMVSTQVQAVLDLEQTLGQRVVGQDHAMRSIARRIQTARAGLDDPEKPVGVFLLAGPSGVGKTETAIALAETLYGGQQNLISINMSEFQESHTVSTLKGAPPGYVGYGEGGVLTEAVRRKPYSVVLLDEIEKAHPDTHEVFFQVFDKGRMEDGEGTSIDFKNTLILLTSNVGSETIMRLCEAGKSRLEAEALAANIRRDLTQVFPPALLGRMVIVPFYPLNDSNLAKIIQLKLDKIIRRIKERYDADVVVSPEVLHLIGSRCTEVESGGRMIDAILTNTVMPEISRRMLESQASDRAVSQIEMSVVDGEIDYRFNHSSQA